MFGLFKNLMGIQTQSAEEIRTALKNGAILLDVRTPGEFLSGSVSGAKNIPLQELMSRLSELKKDKTIVVFCRSGNRSGMAKNILESSGFSNVINAGGLSDIQEIING